MKKIVKKVSIIDKQKFVQELVTKACFLNREIKEVKEQIKVPEKDLDKIKDELKKHYEETLSGGKEIGKFPLMGLTSEDKITICENEKIDPKLLFKALDEEGDGLAKLLAICSISKKDAESVLPGMVVNKCLVKSAGVTIRF
jgi:predicted transcriptional regulator